MNFNHNPVSNNFYKNSPIRNQALFSNPDVEPYWIADMDFLVAPEITKKLKQIVDRQQYAYEYEPDDFYTVMAKWFNSRHQLNLFPERFCYVPGVLTGIAFLINELTEIGDAILIQTPVYHQFAKMINLNHRTLINNSLIEKDNYYTIDYKKLAQEITQNKVKMMLFCNPHNPVGRVWKEDEVKKIVEIAIQHDLYLIVDEIHSEIVFKPFQFQSTTPFTYDKLITIIGSPGKTFGLHSIATGFFYINHHELRKKIKQKIEALYLNHSNILSKQATYVAYSSGAAWVERMLQYVNNNYQWIQCFLAEKLPHIKVSPLEGTYLIWLDFRAYGWEKEILEQKLFREAAIGFAPGDWFGSDGLGFMRMTIASPLEKIKKTFEKLYISLSN